MSKENSNFLRDLTADTKQKLYEAFVGKIDIDDLDGMCEQIFSFDL
jgi:hypothetical protein